MRDADGFAGRDDKERGLVERVDVERDLRTRQSRVARRMTVLGADLDAGEGGVGATLANGERARHAVIEHRSVLEDLDRLRTRICDGRGDPEVTNRADALRGCARAVRFCETEGRRKNAYRTATPRGREHDVLAWPATAR